MPLLWRLLPAFAYGAAIGLGLAWYESERVVPPAALELSWDAPAPGQAPSASEPLEEQQPATRADAEDARIEVERRQYGRSRPIGDSPHVRYRGQIIDYRTPPIY